MVGFIMEIRKVIQPSPNDPRRDWIEKGASARLSDHQWAAMIEVEKALGLPLTPEQWIYLGARGYHTDVGESGLGVQEVADQLREMRTVWGRRTAAAEALDMLESSDVHEERVSLVAAYEAAI